MLASVLSFSCSADNAIAVLQSAMRLPKVNELEHHVAMLSLGDVCSAWWTCTE